MHTGFLICCAAIHALASRCSASLLVLQRAENERPNLITLQGLAGSIKALHERNLKIRLTSAARVGLVSSNLFCGFGE